MKGLTHSSKIANRLPQRTFTMKKIALYLIFAFSTIFATAQTRFDVDGLTYEILSESDRTVEVHDGSNANEILSIPETVSYNGVNYTVTSIGEAALKYCRWLISVDMPNSVTIIGDEAFFGCYVLTSIDIPDCVTSIGDYAFQECDRLTSIAIPNSVISIGIGAFWNCTELTSVTIPNSVTYIGGAAFYNCSKLTSITIPNSVTSIGESTFKNCNGLTTVTIPNSVTTIGDEAFYWCAQLMSVAIPNSVISIGDYAFSGCPRLTSVTIPNSVTSIGECAFYGCSGLTMINVEDGSKHYKSIDGVLFNFDATELVQYPVGNNRTAYIFPNTVYSISDYAFSGCCLTSVSIPNSVTAIGDCAFGSCFGLTSVTIPNSVISIGDYAFMYCHRLQEIINLAEEPQRITSDVFSVVQLGNVRLIVPSSSVEKYKSADVWKEFGTIEGQDAGVGAVETDKIVVSGGVLRNPEGEEIRIYDLNGRKMYSGNGSELRFPAGFYILQTSNGNRKVVF